MPEPIAAGLGRTQTQGKFPVEVTRIGFGGWYSAPRLASCHARSLNKVERSMRHSLFRLFLGCCSIGLVTQSAHAADEGGNGAVQGAPLAALPSQEPAIYEPLPPPLAPRRRFKWGAEFRIEAAPI